MITTVDRLPADASPDYFYDNYFLKVASFSCIHAAPCLGVLPWLASASRIHCPAPLNGFHRNLLVFRLTPGLNASPGKTPADRVA